MSHGFEQDVDAFLKKIDAEPRWPVVVTVLSTALLDNALPHYLTFGPGWLLFVIVGILMIPAGVTYRHGDFRMNRVFGFLLQAVLTTFLIVSITLLVNVLLNGHPRADEILRSAAILWGTNVIVFALWYWRLDAGGPHARDVRDRHEEGDFLFPQMTLDENQLKRLAVPEDWSPRFVDYLFLSFNTSTALSPADTSAMSRWAKVLMILQSTISLTIIVLLAARAVNIL